MLHLSSTLKAKAAQPVKEAWGHFAASLAGWRASDLWELLEDLFGEVFEAEEEEGPSSKKSQPKDKPSTSASVSSVPTLTDTPSTKAKVVCLWIQELYMIKGITQEYLPVQEQLPHSKAI